MASILLLVISALIFISYNAVVSGMFGVPNSLSDTFYLLNSKKKNLGYLFTVMMFSVSFLILPALLGITEVHTEWSGYLTIIPFLSIASLVTVGAAPAFLDNDTWNKVHNTCAIVSAALALIWALVITYDIGWIILAVSIVIMMSIAGSTNTLKRSIIYWLEMIAFMTTYLTAFFAAGDLV